jgi:molybdopterin-guanine dinucleotide biosynthesis protein A
MPLMSPQFFKLMLLKLPGPEAVVMRFDDGAVEPLCGIYSSTCLPVAEQNLVSGRLKITDLLSQVAVEYITEGELHTRGMSRKIFTNVNTPDDLEHLKL